MPGVIGYRRTSIPNVLEVQAYNFSGKLNTMTLTNITDEEFMESFKKWRSGTLIQNAFPSLSESEREFILTGSTDDDWDQMFKEEE
jgi:hypothetical protein